jgi:hypothetical protein
MTLRPSKGVDLYSLKDLNLELERHTHTEHQLSGDEDRGHEATSHCVTDEDILRHKSISIAQNPNPLKTIIRVINYTIIRERNLIEAENEKYY